MTNPHSPPVNMEGVINNNAAPIPGISINKEYGAFIQRLIKRHGEVKIRLTSTDQFAQATGCLFASMTVKATTKRGARGWD